jgi:hypothetical protein
LDVDHESDPDPRARGNRPSEQDHPRERSGKSARIKEKLPSRVKVSAEA